VTLRRSPQLIRGPLGTPQRQVSRPRLHASPECTLLEGPLRHSLLGVGLLLACGCSPRADQVFIAPGIVTGSSGAIPGYAIKLVRGKEAPSVVIGDDGSVCRLTPERFAEVRLDSWLACDWTIEPDTTANIAQAGT
jgi:hypothetical protein